MPSSFETMLRTARSSLSVEERNFDASRSICASSVMSTTSRALSARPGKSMVSRCCACSGAVTAKIRSASTNLRMSASFRKFEYVFARVAQCVAGDAERLEHLLLRALPFAALLDVARGGAADEQREQRGRGERAVGMALPAAGCRGEHAIAKAGRRFLPLQREFQFLFQIHDPSSIRRSERSARWRWLLTVFRRMPAMRLRSEERRVGKE